MSNHNNDYDYNNSDNRNNLTAWIPTLIMLFCFPPVGVVMLIMKVLGLRDSGRANVGRHPYDIQQAARRGGGQSAPIPNSAPAAKKAGAKAGTNPRTANNGEGRGLVIGGAVMAAVFGFGGLSEFLDALSYGSFWSSLSDIFIPLGFAGVGLIMLYLGLSKGKKAKRSRKYLALIGKRDSISVDSLSRVMGVSVHRACGDLQDMLDAGLIPTGYLDLGSGRLVLTDEGLRDEPTLRQQAEPKPPAGMEREDAVLTEIREVNDAIADEEMSRKIDRIGEITGKIFAYLREKPDKKGQMRSFLSYYLPTTLKILRAYAQMEAQGIEGENIKSAKARIEGMMGKVVDGFEKQLDRLFQDDAMDITTDVAVLERMLEKDGLGNQTMTSDG